VCISIVQHVWILIAGLLLWLKDESVNDIVVYNASPPRFLLFPDNSDSDSIIILVYTLFNIFITSK
jgi:hypothetical protein